MTICVCYDGVLYADRAGVAVSRPSFFTDTGKLYVSPCQSFAMAVSGDAYLNDAYYADHMDHLAKKLLQADILNATLELDEKMCAFFKKKEIIILTKKNQYLLTGGFTDAVLRPMEKDIPFFIGSGKNLAAIAMVAGKDVLDAMKIAAIVDPCGCLGPIDSIEQNELLTFRDTEYEKKDQKGNLPTSQP